MPNGAHPATDWFEHAQQESPIMDLLQSSGKLTIEELMTRIPDFSWSQLFLAIDLLTRTGHIILRREGFTYTLETAKPSRVMMGASRAASASDHR